MADLYFPENLTNDDLYPCHIQFIFFERRSTWDSGMADSVHLYMPEKFGQPSTISWDDVKVRDLTASVLSEGAGMIPGAGQGLRGFMEKAQGLVNGPAADLLGLATGQIMNPYITQLFRGVNLRQFDYVFKLIPQKESECETIQDILTIFRKYSLPKGIGGSSLIGTPFLTYPGEVEIRYVFNGQDHPYLHKFKRSIIKSIDIDYTGEGSYATFRNGFPATTTLSIKLGELQIILREDIDERILN